MSLPILDAQNGFYCAVDALQKNAENVWFVSPNSQYTSQEVVEMVSNLRNQAMGCTSLEKLKLASKAIMNIDLPTKLIEVEFPFDTDEPEFIYCKPQVELEFFVERIDEVRRHLS